MAIERLRYTASEVIETPIPQTPQCCAVIQETPYLVKDEWREKRYRQRRPHMDPALCQHTSVFRIDGRAYCRKHAGQVALKMWVDGKLVEKSS